MTTGAWILLGATWAVVGTLTARFFLAVLRSPDEDEDDVP